jgi:hypothetical protein
MFSFLNSGILALAATAIIPLLIYLFAKKKPQKVVFSSIKHILQTQKSEKRKINLQDILLLIIRTLIILLTILAISRPAIKLTWAHSSTSHPKTAVAIVLDNSYSMDYLVDTQTEFEKAKQIAQQINSKISNTDAVVLLTLNPNWNQLNSYLHYGQLPAKKIQKINLTANAASFATILEEAANFLKKSNFSNREIYVISDLQHKNFPKLDEQVLYIPVSQVENPVNISCQKAAFQQDIVDKQYKIIAELVNHSDFVQKDIVYSLFLNGATVSEKVTDLNPKQAKQIEFDLQLTAPGNYSGFVNVREERLTFDNRSYFTFQFTPNPRTLLLTDQPVPTALQALLDVYTNNLTVANEEELEPESNQYDNLLVYLVNCSPQAKSFLRNYNDSDKHYIFLTHANLANNCRELIQEQFNTKLLDFIEEETVITRVDRYHPTVQILENKNLAPIRNYWTAETGARVLLAGNQWPLAVEQNGNILLLFEFTKKNSQFLVNSAFPILMNNALQFTQTQNLNNNQLQLGSGFVVHEEEVVLPEGDKLQIKTNRYFPQEPGIYTSGTQKYAVNLKYSESDFKLIKFPETVKVAKNNWQQYIFTSRYGYEIWKLVLILVLLLFIWEMFLVKKREKR